MDGVLEGAAVLCVCKLACSLLFLPSLAAPHSPVSFCCCCLLIFTDFVVTGFLTFLCIFESWLSDLTPLGDVIALRFLLFLSHTYGVVLLLTTPLIALETVTRLLWPVAHKSQAAGSDGQRCYAGELTGKEEEDSDNPDNEKSLSHVVSYFCCLSVWVVVALNIRWRWKLEEVWTTACLHSTNSLMRCLPNLFSPISSTVNPCWGMAFLSLLLLLLTTSTGLHRRHWVPAEMGRKAREKRRVNNNGGSCWQSLVLALSAPSKPANPEMSVSEATQCVDPEKTESSCTVHRACSWNSMQMSVCHHGDLVLISPQCLSAERGGQEHERTKRCTPLTFIKEDHVDSQYRSQCGWRQSGFHSLGLNVMIGFVGVLSIFVLPLNLSVNILLIRNIETLLELCIKSLVSFTAKTSNTSASQNETLV
ncbi:uncharacterized protein LOC119886243 [Micropterus salmoides]|uniref:uncharacterized protein LOC119886243 n=1 Tax=Micropterus salmoides TaxID=27706 RepID=UPI0018EC8CB9|nr:uncharacterized protein LOC119886243 [Micropterus salmoides]XP_038552770.1 uncharacterized protein LOC119886243 [Micropterus salmoides]